MASKSISETAQRLALAYFDHVEHQVGLAATTAGLVVATNALLIGALVTIVKELHVFQSQWSLASWLFVSSAVCFTVALLTALAAAFPNVRLHYAQTRPVKNVFFFGSISHQSFDDYLSDFQASDRRGELETDLLHQIWGKCQWLTETFRLLQISITITAIGIFVTAVALGFNVVSL